MNSWFWIVLCWSMVGISSQLMVWALERWDAGKENSWDRVLEPYGTRDNFYLSDAIKGAVLGVFALLYLILCLGIVIYDRVRYISLIDLDK